MAGKPRKLTPQQERFCQEYLIDLNGSAAYRRAYPKAKPKSADANAARLLANARVAARVSELQQARSERTRVTADRVLLEVARIAFLDPRQVMEWGPDGVRLRPSATLPEDAARCVVECSETVTESGGTIRVKLANKLEALKLAGDHIGMWKAPAAGPDPLGDLIRQAIASDLAARAAARPDPPGPPTGQPVPAGQGGPAQPLADAPPPLPDR